MGRLLLRWILLAVSVWTAAMVTQALGLGFEVDIEAPADAVRFFVGVAVLAFLNATLGAVLRLLTIPLNCLTLGLASVVVNALMLWLAASLGLGFHLEGEAWQKLLAAIVGTLLISFINGVLGTFVEHERKEREED